MTTDFNLIRNALLALQLLSRKHGMLFVSDLADMAMQALERIEADYKLHREN